MPHRAIQALIFFTRSWRKRLNYIFIELVSISLQNFPTLYYGCLRFSCDANNLLNPW